MDHCSSFHINPQELGISHFSWIFSHFCTFIRVFAAGFMDKGMGIFSTFDKNLGCWVIAPICCGRYAKAHCNFPMMHFHFFSFSLSQFKCFSFLFFFPISENGELRDCVRIPSPIIPGFTIGSDNSKPLLLKALWSLVGWVGSTSTQPLQEFSSTEKGNSGNFISEWTFTFCSRDPHYG